MSDGTGNNGGGLTGGTDEIFAFVGNGIPIPLEELDGGICGTRVRTDGGCGRGLSGPLPAACLGAGAAKAREMREARARNLDINSGNERGQIFKVQSGMEKSWR